MDEVHSVYFLITEILFIIFGPACSAMGDPDLCAVFIADDSGRTVVVKVRMCENASSYVLDRITGLPQTSIEFVEIRLSFGWSVYEGENRLFYKMVGAEGRRLKAKKRP